MSGDSIYFGATVTLACGDDTLLVRIVGSDEINPAKRYISIDSPLARALLKKQTDDKVIIHVEGQSREYWVLHCNTWRSIRRSGRLTLCDSPESKSVVAKQHKQTQDKDAIQVH